MGLLCNCRATAEITNGAIAIGPINVGYSLRHCNLRYL